MKYLGSCLCGRIKYEISGEYKDFFLCTCQSCSGDSGVSNASILLSSKAELIWLKGEKERKTFDFNKTGHIMSYCPFCSSLLPNIQKNEKLLVAPSGSFDSNIDFISKGTILK